jgi:hypothetical protein
MNVKGGPSGQRSSSFGKAVVAAFCIVAVIAGSVSAVVVATADASANDAGNSGAMSGEGTTMPATSATTTSMSGTTTASSAVPTLAPTPEPSVAPTPVPLPALSPNIYVAPPGYSNPHIDALEVAGAFDTVVANQAKDDVRQCWLFRDESVLLRNVSCSNAKYGLRLEGDAGTGKHHAVQGYTFTDWARYDAYGAGVFLGGKSSESPLANAAFLSVINVSVNLDWESYSTTNVDCITNDGASSDDARVYVEYARLSRGADGAIDVKGPMSFSRSYFHATRTNRLIRVWGSVKTIYFSHCVFESDRSLFWLQNEDAIVYYHNCLFNGNTTVTPDMMDGDTGCGVDCFRSLDEDPLPQQHAFFANNGA